MALDDAPLEHYRENLRHVVRPDSPRDRQEAVDDSIALVDYEALYLRAACAEYAAYGDAGRDIALAYEEYLEHTIKGEGKPFANVYAHTDLAKQTLLDVMDYFEDQSDAPHVHERIADLIEGLGAEA